MHSCSNAMLGCVDITADLWPKQEQDFEGTSREPGEMPKPIGKKNANYRNTHFLFFAFLTLTPLVSGLVS